MPKVDPTRHALGQLVKKVRHQGTNRERRPAFMIRRVPSDLARPDFRGLTLGGPAAEAFNDANAQLYDDKRFEWVNPKKLEEQLWRLACEAKAKPAESGLVDAFVDEYAREPRSQTCFWPVEGLDVAFPVELFGIRLVPVSGLQPHNPLAAFEELVKAPGANPVGCVAAIGVSGTSGRRMAERAREAAEHALRQLRMTLREHREISDRDVRFRLGNMWWIDEGSHHFTIPGGRTSLHLGDDLVKLATSRPVARLPASGGRNVDDHARIALGWFEKSQLVEDQVSQMLYLFFALEAILGDKAEGPKGENLALRRAILGLRTTGFFVHPRRVYVLYGDVRSEAVHGGGPVEVTDQEVLRFSADIRTAINEFLEFANREAHTRRAQVRRALDEDEGREELAANLYREDPTLWASLKPRDTPGS